MPCDPCLCRCRERDFLKKIHECLERNGKVSLKDPTIRVYIILHVHVYILPQVLIPVFALGRAQELCILLETFWYQHTHLPSPPSESHELCFPQGQNEPEVSHILLYWTHREGRCGLLVFVIYSFFLLQANHYYKMFITWTNQKIRSTFVQRNMFEFKHITVCLQ